MARLNQNTPSKAPVRSQKKLAGFIAFALLTMIVTTGKNHQIFDPKSEIAQHPAFHRTLGYVYVACVLLGAPLGIAVASRVTPHGWFWAAVIQPLEWMFSTAVALYSIRNGNVADHRRWMIRGYSSTET